MSKKRSRDQERRIEDEGKRIFDSLSDDLLPSECLTALAATAARIIYSCYGAENRECAADILRLGVLQFVKHKEEEEGK